MKIPDEKIVLFNFIDEVKYPVFCLLFLGFVVAPVLCCAGSIVATTATIPPMFQLIRVDGTNVM